MDFNSEQNSENLFYLMLDDLAQGIQLIGLDWRYRYLNKAAIVQSRRTKEELLGHTMMHCFPGFEFTELYQALSICMRNHTPRKVEHTVVQTNGAAAMYEMMIEPFQDGILILSVDITERKNAERALRESEERFSVAFRSSPTGMAISRLEDGRFLDVNDETCRIYGFTREQVIGRTSLELRIIQPETRKKLVESLKTNRHLRNVELDISAGTGELHNVLFSWEPIEINNEPCVVATIADITERKRIDAMNLRLQRMESVGSLAGGIVHDMNNILAPIMMVLSRLRKNLADPEDQKIVDLLENNSKRAADLMKQILTFARGSESKRAPLQISLVLKEVVEFFKSTFPAHISIRTNFSKSLWSISGDSTQLHQVLVNLAVNARDAMPEGGTLTIDAENCSIDEHDTPLFPGAKPGLYVLITVADTGTGIPAEVKKKIFDPFFTTKEIGKGTGLGLSTVSSIVKGHGGFIDLQSRVGEGTQFKIYLPVVASTVAAEEQRAALEAVQGNGETILLVDDDGIVREIAMISLDAGGYRVITAADGTEAVGLYGKYIADIRLVITDMDMPDLDGATLVRIVRKMNPDVTIIGSSGTADAARLDKLNEAGIDAFLPKPYTSEILLKVIHETLHSQK